MLRHANKTTDFISHYINFHSKFTEHFLLLSQKQEKFFDLVLLLLLFSCFNSKSLRFILLRNNTNLTLNCQSYFLVIQLASEFSQESNNIYPYRGK